MSQPENKQTNYSLSIFLTLLGSIGLVIAFLALHLFDFPPETADWIFDIVLGTYSISFISTLVSGNGYFFMMLDRLFENTTLWDRFKEMAIENVKAAEPEQPKKSFWKKIKTEAATVIGLVLGVAGAVALTVVEVVKHVPIFGKVVHAGKGICDVLGFIFNLSTCGGLGNRIGRVIDIFRNPQTIKEAARTKNINYALAIVGGIIMGIVLAALVIHTGGAALPVVLGVISAVGSSASAAGYIGRVFDFVLGRRTIVHAAKDAIELKQLAAPAAEVETISQRANKEAIGTTIGVGIGIALGVILIVAGVATLPFFGFGTAKIMAGILLLTSCVSMGGGLGNRIGHFWDKFNKKQSDVKAEPIIADKTIAVDPSNVPAVLGPTQIPAPQPAATVTQSYNTIATRLAVAPAPIPKPIIIDDAAVPPDVTPKKEPVIIIQSSESEKPAKETQLNYTPQHFKPILPPFNPNHANLSIKPEFLQGCSVGISSGK